MSEWCGEGPRECQLCLKPIKSSFIDGKVKLGGWAIMCEGCHKLHGVGLGIGKGQIYEKEGKRWKRKDGC